MSAARRRGLRVPRTGRPSFGERILRGVARPLLALALPVAARLGADPRAVREIVEVKLTLDLRRGSALQQAHGKKAGGLMMTAGMLMLIGGFFALGQFAIEEPVLAMGLAQTVTFWMLTAILLTDYADLILDSVDDEVLGPQPISDRTLLAAQLVHVAIYLVVVMVSVQLPSLVTGCLSREPLTWALGLVVCTPLATACSLLGIVLLSQLVVALAGRARARSVMVSAQVAMTVTLMLGGQLPNLLRGSDLIDTFTRLDEPWLLALPPLWFGGLFDRMVGGDTPLGTPLAILALAVPLVCLVAALRFSGARLHGADRETVDRPPRRPGPLARLGASLTTSPTQQAAHDLVLALSRREKGFRMRTYPMLFMPLAFIIPIVRKDLGPDELHHIGKAGYFCLVFLPVLAVQVRHGDQPEAAWLFKALPIRRLGELLTGTVLALVTGFLLPWCLAVAVVAMLLAGPSCLPDLLLSITLSLAVSLLFLSSLVKQVPFSQRFVQSVQAGQFGTAMLSMLLVGLMVGLHTLLGLVPFGVWGGLVGAALLLLQGLRSARRLEHRQVSLVLPRS